MIPVKYIKVYQYVQLGNRSMTFFSTNDPTLKGLELKLNTDLHVIEMIYKDTIICVPLNNVQYFEMNDHQIKPQSKKSKPTADA